MEEGGTGKSQWRPLPSQLANDMCSTRPRGFGHFGLGTLRTRFAAAMAMDQMATPSTPLGWFGYPHRQGPFQCLNDCYSWQG
jgi:hypothetical protein